MPTASIPKDEYTLEKEAGHNQLTLYWTYPGSYENCDIWMWWDGKEGSGHLFHECEYGAKVVVNVPEGITEVGFIVRRDCSEPGGNAWGSATKDFNEDRFAVIEGEETFIYLKSGVGSQYTSNDGGKTLDMIKKFTLAGIIDFDQIQYNLTPATRLNSLDQVKVYQGGNEIKIKAISTLNRDATNGYVTLTENLDISKPYEIEIEGYGKKVVVPTAVSRGGVITGVSIILIPKSAAIPMYLSISDQCSSLYTGTRWASAMQSVWNHWVNISFCSGHTSSLTSSVKVQERSASRSPSSETKRKEMGYSPTCASLGTFTLTHMETVSIAQRSLQPSFSRGESISGMTPGSFVI